MQSEPLELELEPLNTICIGGSGIETFEHNTTDTGGSEEDINPDYIKVSEITGWDEKIVKYFVDEAEYRGVSVFEEALPIISIETGNTYRFDLVNNNTNGTSDIGTFQINDITYPYIVKSLKNEGREFDSWCRFDPQFNIAAGVFWLSHLKNYYNLEDEVLFTSYNRGVMGAKNYASRNGTYVTNYSKTVKSISDDLTSY